MYQRVQYHQPNPKHAITFAIVSTLILLLPLFWSPLNSQPIGQAFPEASPTAAVADGLAVTPQNSAPKVKGVPEKSWGPLPTPVLAGATPTGVAPAGVASTGVTPAASPVVAALPEAPAQEASVVTLRREPTLDFSYHLRRMILSLLLTVVLIAATLKVVQKFLPAWAGGKATRGSFLNILAREAIGPGQSLALVRVGPKVLLVGLSEQSMTTLCEFSESEQAELMPPESPAQTPAEKPDPQKVYGDILRHYLSIVPGMGVKK